MSRMGSRIDPSMMTALAAGLVSVSALSVSIYEAYLQRQEQRVSVWPIIEFWTSYSANGFAIRLANKGIGPGEIRDVRVTYQGRPMRSWKETFAPVLGDEAANYSHSMVIGNVTAPGDVVTMLQYEPDQAARAREASEGISMSVCYCSVFGDCWVHSQDDIVVGRGRRERVEECPAVDSAAVF